MIYSDLAMMAGVSTVCKECVGKRFQASALEYRLGGLKIAEALDQLVSQAVAYFSTGEANAGRAHAPEAPG